MLVDGWLGRLVGGLGGLHGTEEVLDGDLLGVVQAEVSSNDSSERVRGQAGDDLVADLAVRNGGVLSHVDE